MPVPSDALAVAARDVALVMAPVTAALAGQDGDVRALVAETVAAGGGPAVRLVSVSLIEAFLAAPEVVAFAPTALAEFPVEASRRFDDVVVEVGAVALRAGLLRARPAGRLVFQLLEASALDVGQELAARAAVVGSWWALLSASRFTGRDPVSVVRQVGLSVASFDR